MKNCGIEVIEPILRSKNCKQINFGCSKKEQVPVIAETDSQFTKLSLRSVSVQNFDQRMFAIHEASRRHQKKSYDYKNNKYRLNSKIR